MNLIVMLPIICCIIIFYRYSSLLKAELQDTQSLIDRYALYQELERGTFSARTTRLAVAFAASETSAGSVAKHIEYLNSIDMAHYGLPDSDENKVRLNEIRESYTLFIEAIEAGLEPYEIIDIANSTIASVLTLIASQPLEVDDAQLQNGMNSYLTLVRLQEAASRETTLKALVKTTGNLNNYRDELVANKGAQQGLIDDYIQRFATNEQTEELHALVTNEIFVQANQSYNDLISGHLKPSELDLVSAQKRESLLQALIQKIQLETLNKAKFSFSDSQAVYRTTIGVIALLIVALIVLGYLIGRRTLKGLKEIGLTLQAVEDKSNPDRRIPVDGSDEFATLGATINTLIDSRQKGEQKLIEAKEEAERANEAKSIFLANMSHEMRTPLNGIIGMGKILSATQMSGVQKGYLQTIQTSSKALLGIINDVLDISKIESNSLVIAPVDVITSEHVDDVISIISPKAQKEKLEFILDYDMAIPARLEMDDLRIRQIVLNLMSNAVKFTEKGSVTLKVSVSSQVDNTVWLKYDVIDTGIGIKEDKVASIFNPFEQEDVSITRKYAGTGLGLTISRQLADLMGGKIYASSVIGEGSTFTLEVPVKLSTKKIAPEPPLSIQMIGAIDDLSFSRFAQQVAGDTAPYDARVLAVSDWREAEGLDESPVPLVVVKPLWLTLEGSPLAERDIAALISLPATPTYIERKIRDMLVDLEYTESNPAIDGKRKRILVVEDNPVNQQVAAIMLEDEGYEITLADDGEKGVKAWQELRHDVILMDCMMPVMDGLTATETIREIERQENVEQTVPIIALTASTIDEDIKRCFEVGMNNYIPKPFELKVLLDAINKRY